MTNSLFKTRRDLYILPVCVVLNILLVMILYTLCRGVFIEDNIIFFGDLTRVEMVKMFRAGLIFDLSAVLYTNLLYIALAMLPVPGKETGVYQGFLKWTFFVPNAICLLANMADSVYFPFANRRTTFSFFKEFAGEDNLGEIFWTEVLNHWYMAVILVAMAAVLYVCYFHPRSKIWLKSSKSGWKILPVRPATYYLVHFLILASVAYPVVGGLRGGFGRQTRPITISNANRYVKTPREAALVLNTPFSMMQTIAVESFPVPEYFTQSERGQMEEQFCPVHYPSVDKPFEPLNVVVLIMESFGREYSGYLNQDIPGYTGYTPFLDSLMRESYTFKYSYANGHKSIDAMPSVLSGIPMFVEPFFLTPYSLNDVTSVAGELRKKGYYTAFFHGAKNGSMGFEAYARTSGFKDYFGRTEYGQWLGHDDSADYDGYWGIWDEPFMQFFADEMSSFEEPFCTGIFTVSSHHPFVVPERYEGKFPKGHLPIHQCIGSSDHALRRFFETASKTEWYDHTLFVITGDHTNQTYLDEYKTDAGVFGVPIIFYYPAGNISGVNSLRGIDSNCVAQQADIMPTVLGFLGYDTPFVAFGCDLFNTPPEETFAVNYDNGFYQFFRGDYMLQYDGSHSLGLYRFRMDVFLENNLVSDLPDIRSALEMQLKAIIQQYMERMNDNQLTVK